MKYDNGITLLEVLITMSLLTLVLFAGSGVYLSSSNIYEGASDTTQAQRNAQIVMMHIKKITKDCASNFKVLDSNGVHTLEFRVYDDNLNKPTVVRKYEFSNDRLVYYPNRDAPGIVVSAYISNCNFVDNGYAVDVTITALDDKRKNAYTLSSRISAGATSVPAVYEVDNNIRG